MPRSEAARIASRHTSAAPWLIAGMDMLNKPYVEMGVGLTNIFRILRVDAVWRMTHRYKDTPTGKVKTPNRFDINIGLELRF